MGDDNEEYSKKIPGGLFGIPGTAEIGKWRDIVEEAIGGSEGELCGLKADEDGNLLGIFRAKKNAE